MEANKHHKPLKISLPEEHLSYWMRYVSNNVAFTFSRELAKNRVTVAEWIILRLMYTQGWMSPANLVSCTSLTPGAISKLMDRLIGKGLVVKQTSAQDRRYKRMRLTPAGHKMVPSLARIADYNDKQFFGNLSATQKSQLIGLLKSIAKTYRFKKSLNVHIKKDKML